MYAYKLLIIACFPEDNDINVHCWNNTNVNAVAPFILKARHTVAVMHCTRFGEETLRDGQLSEWRYAKHRRRTNDSHTGEHGGRRVSKHIRFVPWWVFWMLDNGPEKHNMQVTNNFTRAHKNMARSQFTEEEVLALLNEDNEDSCSCHWDIFIIIHAAAKPWLLDV